MAELKIPHPIAGSAKKDTARVKSEPTDRMETPPFSLVCGGPLFQLFRMTRLSGDRLLHHRLVVVICLTWLEQLPREGSKSNVIQS
jgi:hypothetical protein